MTSLGLVLAMDAAAGGGTLALLHGGMLRASREVVMRSEREERFFPALLDLVAAEGFAVADVEAMVVGAGPGSFTALRVVAATAKGIAHARRIPIYAVPSLALTVLADASTARGATRWLSTLDALRGERYAALVELDEDGELRSVEQLGLVPAAEIPAKASALGAMVIGPDEAHRAGPHARGIVRAQRLLAAASPVELASWEPVYGRLAEAQVKWEAAHGRPLG